MATFTATNLGADMMKLFAFVNGDTPIDQIVINNDIGLVGVADVYEHFPAVESSLILSYRAPAVSHFDSNGTIPTEGTFTEVQMLVYQGGLTLLAGTLQVSTNGDFADIINEGAYDILDSDDTLDGGDGVDILFGGFDGTDTYIGRGGGGGSGTDGDTFVVSSRNVGASSFTGTSGQSDTIKVIADINGFSTLDLRGATLLSMNRIETDGLNVQIAAGQVDHGLSESATVVTTTGTAVFAVFMAGTTTVDLSKFTIGAGVTVSVLGTTAAETITGTNSNDVMTPGDGNDTVNGLGGNDTFNVIGAGSEFATFNGGSGSDTLMIFGATAFTLNGFNAASQGIEVWEGSGQGLDGNGNANVFDLAGLTTKTGLTAINGLGGNDTITGSKFADTIAASGTEAQFDTMNGGLGTDTFRVDGSGPLTLNGFNAASQSIEVWDGNGQGVVGNGNGNVFNLAGLTGMTDLPFIDGGAGDDTIAGSGFADAIRGGLGVDTMTGGLGSDRFDFDAVAEIGKKKGQLDLISDWGAGDTIDLSSIDANGAKTGDKAWKFLKKEGADFTKAGQVGFDQKKGVTFVQGDTNGDGKADFKLEVTGKIDFEKADFIL